MLIKSWKGYKCGSCDILFWRGMFRICYLKKNFSKTPKTLKCCTIKKNAFFLLKMYYKTESLKAVQRAYQAEYNCKGALFFVRKTRFGCWDNRKQKTYQPLTRKEVKNQLKTVIAENHKLSTRKAASVLQCSQTLIVTVQNSISHDPHLYPFHDLINIWKILILKIHPEWSKCVPIIILAYFMTTIFFRDCLFSHDLHCFVWCRLDSMQVHKEK